MKNSLIFLIIIIFFSCNNNKTKNTKQLIETEYLIDSVRFSKKIDTIYELNSTKISQITRQFYAYTLYPEKPINKSDNIFQKKELELEECYSNNLNKGRGIIRIY